MKVFLLKWLTVSFAVALGSSIVSMMASFVGSQGEDLRDLLLLQVALIPVAIIVVFWCFAEFVQRDGVSKAFRVFWQTLPGWLLFAAVMASSLVLIAELSFGVLQYHTGNSRPWLEHVPAATALASSLAMMFCYVGYRLASSRTFD